MKKKLSTLMIILMLVLSMAACAVSVELREYVHDNFLYQEIVVRIDSGYLDAAGVDRDELVRYVGAVIRLSTAQYYVHEHTVEGGNIVIIARRLSQLPPNHRRHRFHQSEFNADRSNWFFNHFERIRPHPLANFGLRWQESYLPGFDPADITTFNTVLCPVAIIRGGLAQDNGNGILEVAILPLHMAFPPLYQDLNNLSLVFFWDNPLNPRGLGSGTRFDTVVGVRQFHRFDYETDTYYIITRYIRPRALGWNVVAITAGLATTALIVIVSLIKRRKFGGHSDEV